MDPADSLTLEQLLSLATLMAATCEYVEIVRQRKTRRRADCERLDSEAAGLRGLVRVFLADSPRPHTDRTYLPE